MPVIVAPGELLFSPNFGAALPGGVSEVPAVAAPPGPGSPGNSMRGTLPKLTASGGGSTGGLLVSVTYAP
jgi:hypothetical protein